MTFRNIGKTLTYDVLPTDICKVNQVALNQAEASDKKGQKHRSRGLTRDTRATIMQVLDRRTMIILERSKKRGVFTNMYGTISTGKEANVYRGTVTFSDLKLYAQELKTRNCLLNEDLEAIDEIEKSLQLKYINRAIKVFKTSVLTFKDRSKYVEGEFRFRRGYLKSKNPRKMVTQWCEKEFRNLRRIVISGIRCPVPIYIKKHIFVMSFIGNGSNLENEQKNENTYDNKQDIDNLTENAAPRLKDVPLNIGRKNWLRVYIEAIGIMHIMFNECRLVHGDMSEYNILFYRGHIYVIDVSQSMEHDHPLALEFLKRDCINITIFFNKVLDSRKNLEISELNNIEYNTTEIDDEQLLLNGLLNQVSKYLTTILLSPFELYNLITRVASRDLISFFEESINSDEEQNNNVKNIILNILESNELIWPSFDDVERENELKCSYMNSQKNEILNKSLNNNKLFLSILYFVIHRLISNNRYSNIKLDLFGQLTEEEINLKSNDGSNVFLNTWSPIHLNQITDRKTLEKELDRKECGQRLLYGHFICDKNSESSNIETDDRNGTETGSYSSSERSQESILDLEISSLNLSDSDTSLGSRIAEEDNRSDDSSIISTESLSEETNENKNISKQFNGRIPENFTKKEWKQKVKQENRERRLNKIPKHIKKKKKKKHSQKKHN